jgi:RNA polymerase-interacting CarD/CdnL/TRCF family regulator
MVATQAADLPFESGDTVVHPYQGAGTIEKIVSLKRHGETKRFYSIDLIGRDAKLMTPVGVIDDVGLRPASTGEDDIRDLFMQEPEPLADNYRTRHANLRDRLGSGDPSEIARVLRDLAWRERVDSLTKIDMDLKRKAVKMLRGELAAYASTTLSTASRKLNKIIRSAMDHHLEARKN